MTEYLYELSLMLLGSATSMLISAVRNEPASEHYTLSVFMFIASVIRHYHDA